MTLIRMHQTRAIVTAALAVLVCLVLLVIQARPTTPVPSQQFQGYSIELPAETKLVNQTTGTYGETRVTYLTPVAERIMTIAFAPSFGWSEFSEELTTQCPGAIEGPQQPINWAGSLKGGYTGWRMEGCDVPDLVTFITFSENDSAVAVVYYGSATAPGWLIRAIERAQWTE